MEGWKSNWLMALAEVMASRERESYMDAIALYTLAQAISGDPPMEQDSATIYAQLLAATSQFDRLDESSLALSLGEEYQWSVLLDSVNPFTTGSRDNSEWLDRLNYLLTPSGLEPVYLAAGETGAQQPFELLTCEPTTYLEDSSKVTVIMSAFRPESDIFASIHSILKQSWRNLELIVVDDASGSNYDPILKQIKASDPRIRILQNPVNLGTYAIRNLAMQHASGEYVTFQDSDDWSHPRRIEYQVRAVRSHPDILASRIRSIRLFPDLTSSYPGYPPIRMSAVSLLFERRNVMDLIGGFDHVRKSADVEFPARLEAAAPGTLLDLKEVPPLMIVQLRQGSLSRNDAAPGWLRWNRLAYRDSYTLWHEAIKSGKTSPRFDDIGSRPFPIPEPSFSPEEPGVRERPYDLIVIGDFRRQRWDEFPIRVLHSAIRSGRQTAIAHVETSMPPSKFRGHLARPVQRLINSGTVDLVHVSSSVQAETVLVASSDILLEPPDAVELKPDRVIVAMRGRLNSSDVGADVRCCARGVDQLFLAPVTWLPADPGTHQALTAIVRDGEVADLESDSMPDLIEAARLRERVAGRRPVVGRIGPDGDWPSSIADLLGAYPVDERFDVRILGGARGALRLLDRKVVPPNWVVVDGKRVPLSRFVSRTDFIVLTGIALSDTGMDGALTAMRCGSVVIASPVWRAKLGHGAIYSEPSNVVKILRALCGDTLRLIEQRRRGYDYATGYYTTTQHVYATERALGLRSAHAVRGDLAAPTIGLGDLAPRSPSV